jgi:hypothetical protein
MFFERLPILVFVASVALAQQIPAECSSPWLPLQTGNYWLYSSDSRFTTRQHHTLRVLGPYELAGRVYCQLEDRTGDSLSHRFLRVDAQGRIYQYFVGAIAETLLLDPSQAQDLPYQGPLNLEGKLIQFNGVNPFLRTRYEFAAGVGLVSLLESLIAGSSGGFSFSETLLEAKIGDKIYRTPLGDDPQLSLSTDSIFANCAIPCYYAACGLGSPVDPPRTIKPCLRTRMQVSRAPAGAALVLELRRNDSVYRSRFALLMEDTVFFDSVPFYTQSRIGAPVTLLESGEYVLSLSLEDASGTVIQSLALRKKFSQTLIP